MLKGCMFFFFFFFQKSAGFMTEDYALVVAAHEQKYKRSIQMS